MESKDNRHHRSLSQIQEFIQRNDDFLITTHINPDGDCIASVLVFASILKHLGKSYTILIDDSIPKKFNFLSGIEEILRFDRQSHRLRPMVLVVLDSSDFERIGNVCEIISSETFIINIDHHPSNQGFGSINVVDAEESSAVEIVYALFTYCNIPVTPEIATLVYTGIMCDTGRFLFPNTTSRSLRVCSEMVRMGASPDHIAEKIYYKSSQNTILALSLALSTLEFYFDGSVTCIHLSNGILSSSDDVDTEGFVDYLLAIEGTEVEFFMLEKKPNCFRVSFRSKRYIDVNKIAQTFGGGGHTRASGCTIEGSVEEVKKKILDVLKVYL
jgi:phosphoesterase RecJ-like protein